MKLISKQAIASFPIAIIKSCFNQSVTTRLMQGAKQRLVEQHFNEDHITVVEVPGAIEIPLIAQRLAQSKRYLALIALGAVIRGETDHFDYACTQVSHGCQRVSLDYNIPVIFAILTSRNIEQALARCGGIHGHKGSEAVDSAIAMVSILQQLG